MNKFESNKPETSHEEHKDIIEYYETRELIERMKIKVECGPHVEELKTLFALFELSHSIGVLRTIKTEEEALSSRERESAKEALIPMVDKIKFLDRRTDISEDELDGLRKKYKIISNAVGMINNGVVDHDR